MLHGTLRYQTKPFSWHEMKLEQSLTCLAIGPLCCTLLPSMNKTKACSNSQATTFTCLLLDETANSTTCGKKQSVNMKNYEKSHSVLCSWWQ